jgi:DNA-binding NtrC family response regulator
VLVAEPDAATARPLAARLRARGNEVVIARDAEGAINALARAPFDALVCALGAPPLDGLAVLAAARARRPGVCAVLVAAPPVLERAVEAMRLGAWDVLARPAGADDVLASLHRGLEHASRAARADHRDEGRERRVGPLALTGGSRAIRRALEQVQHVAPTRAPVLIEGEEGTGRSVVARMLHSGSARADGPFVWADCSPQPEGVLEAELCGLEPFGGPERPGRIELAEGGTLVLHEVEHLPARAQVVILRLLQDRTVERVGGAHSRRVDVRVLATTSRDLGEAARAGAFRGDLVDALALVRIALPPLRERREDIPLLVEQLVGEVAREHGRRRRRLTRGVVDRLVAHDWPGNVAELKRVLEGVIVTARGRGPIDVSALPTRLRDTSPAHDAPHIEVGMTLAESERALVEATMRQTGGDKPLAAEMLGIGLRTLYRMLDRHGLR